eukprot:scaffold778_cov263-Pinguiococcus_pyrenoidosus.AAC.5
MSRSLPSPCAAALKHVSGGALCQVARPRLGPARRAPKCQWHGRGGAGERSGRLRGAGRGSHAAARSPAADGLRRRRGVLPSGAWLPSGIGGDRGVRPAQQQFHHSPELHRPGHHGVLGAAAPERNMRWLDYPTKTLFKSSRMLLTMLAGVAFLNKRYGWVQWGSAVMILLGLVLFTCGDAIVSSDFNAFGVLMILG